MIALAKIIELQSKPPNYDQGRNSKLEDEKGSIAYDS